jgi:hypothetical protein
LYQRENIEYYYTCPAKATRYNDTVGIISHYEGVLREINQPWVWVFDGTGFNFIHSLEIDIGIQLVSILSKNVHLYKIMVIHPTIYVSMIYTVLYPFLGERLRDMIEFNTDV